jgi:hypothetical protein
LYQGDFALWENDAAKEPFGRSRIQEALTSEGDLEPADVEYARGVLADGTTAAVRHFDEAVEHDRFHLRANCALLMELVISGQFGRARDHATFMARAFPREPVVPLARALMAAMEDDEAAGRRYRQDLAALVRDAERMGGG